MVSNVQKPNTGYPSTIYSPTAGAPNVIVEGGQSAHVQAIPSDGTAYTGQPQQIVVTVGNCPRCRSGFLTNEFTCCGVCLGVCFFPIGLLCCYAMRERRCNNCNAVYK